ncbi:unnamed protein product [Thelazia callipaeda]|uniref:PrgI family protein n=1 Tax=Thelazia callipaeda TaxID=103827 RepID=A0A0N5CMQ8_THECL|nr:unnamed protein product [Thelazia callipaeda]
MTSGDECVEEVPLRRKIGLKEKVKADPGFLMTMMSTFVNFTLASMFLYGTTGNPRLGVLAGVLSVPFSAVTNILFTENDYKAWKETKQMRARGVPEIIIPKKVKYDWEYYEPLREEIERFYEEKKRN